MRPILAMLAMLAILLAACGPECELVGEPGNLAARAAAQVELAPLSTTCLVGGQTAEGVDVKGQLTWVHDLDAVEVQRWLPIGRRRVRCDPSVRLVIRSRVVLHDADGAVVEAEGPALLTEPGLMMTSVDAEWRAQDDLPRRVANPAWSDPRVSVDAGLEGDDGCGLTVSVEGEGELHTIDVGGRREVLTVVGVGVREDR